MKRTPTGTIVDEDANIRDIFEGREAAQLADVFAQIDRIKAAGIGPLFRYPDRTFDETLTLEIGDAARR